MFDIDNDLFAFISLLSRATDTFPLKEELERLELEQEETTRSITSTFQEARKIAVEQCDKQELILLKQCHDIYTTRREQLWELNQHLDTKESQFVTKLPPPKLWKDIDNVQSLLHSSLAEFQLLSQPNADTKIHCVAGLKKTAILDKQHLTNKKDTCDKDEMEKIVPHLGSVRLNGKKVTCQFDAPNEPGEYLLQVSYRENQNFEATVAVRPYPLHLDVPVWEFVKANARYCSVRNGKLYVTSRRCLLVSSFDVNTGKPLETLGRDFKKGRGIIATDDSLLVADAVRSEFGVISLDRKYETKWFGAGELQYPLGMTLGHDNKLYIASMKTKKIVIFRPDGHDWVYESSIPVEKKPYDLAFDSNDNIHLVCGDVKEKVKGVFVYTKSGEYLMKYGEKDVKCAGGITIDQNGFSYVTEYSQEGRLVVFNRNGHCVSSSQSLDYPMGVCVDEEGSLFVTSNLRHRVLQF